TSYARIAATASHIGTSLNASSAPVGSSATIFANVAPTRTSCVSSQRSYRISTMLPAPQSEFTALHRELGQVRKRAPPTYQRRMIVATASSASAEKVIDGATGS